MADNSAESVFVYPALGSSTGCSTRPPSPPSAGATPTWTPKRHRGGFQRQNLCGGRRRHQRVCLFDAGKQHRANVAPIATISTTMTTGLSFPEGIALDSSGKIYVADAVLTGRRFPERVCLCGGEQRQRRPHRHHQREQHRPGVTSTASRWIPAAKSMWRTTAPPACLSIRPGAPATSPPPPPSAGATPA